MGGAIALPIGYATAVYVTTIYFKNIYYLQRWSRGHKARGQGQPFRGQALSRPRTGMLEA